MATMWSVVLVAMIGKASEICTLPQVDSVCVNQHLSAGQCDEFIVCRLLTA